MRTRYSKILVTAALSALASMAILASVANAATPPAPYQDFAGCQTPAENEAVASCIKVTFSGGHLRLGKKNIPITAPIVLRGDLEQATENFNYNSEGGIVPVRQMVEGGLFGTTGNKAVDQAMASHNAFKVFATVESAGKPSTFAAYPFTVPVKVHLENPFLGSSCYIGSEAAPIALNLTASKEPTEFAPEAGRPAVEAQSGGIMGDNTFTVPAASGCVLTVGSYHLDVSKLINSSWGLPSAAGKSEAVFNFGTQYVPASVVFPG
jgi:hypothetical protein